MDSYQECEVCGGVTDGRFFCSDHEGIIDVVKDALNDLHVTNRPRWIAVKVSRYLRSARESE